MMGVNAPKYHHLFFPLKRNDIPNCPRLLRFNSSVPTPGSSPLSAEEIIKRGQEAEEQQEKEEQSHIQETTGVIEKTHREGILYFSDMYPVAPVSYVAVSQLLSLAFGLTETRVANILTTHAIPQDYPVSFTQIIPRYKDGGVFAKYRIATDAPPELSTKDVESVLHTALKDSPYRPLHNPFRKMRVFSVRGVPWIEDLQRRVSRKVSVVFEGDDLSQETLYSVLRRYGPIREITSATPTSKDSKIKCSVVEYSRKKDASSARNCVNSLVVGNTKIHITYVAADDTSIFQKTIVDHPRISIPIILALFAAVAVFVFNPIRAFFVERKVTGTTLASSFENYSIVRWIQKVTRETFTTLSRYLRLNQATYAPSFESLWAERQQTVHRIRQWLDENVNTFIVVTGPRGNGKRELVTNFIVGERPNVLSIDCDQLIKAQNDPTFIRLAASQLGYFPVFPWMNNLATYFDLIIQGLTGQKSGFAESTEDQFKSMLTTTVTALRRIALSKYGDAAKEEVIRANNGDECSYSQSRASSFLTEDAYLQLHSEVKPVVVISHFMSKTDHTHQFVYKLLAEFASVLVQTNLAHVIFITNDATYESVLSPALPNRLFKVATVGDADPNDAKRFVLNQIYEARITAQKAAAAFEAWNNGGTYDSLANDPEKEKKEEEELQKAKEELVQIKAQSASLGGRVLGFFTGVFSSRSKEDKETPVTKTKKGRHESSPGLILPGDDFDQSSIDEEFPFLDYALTPLGGRLTDLQAFARRLKSGQAPLDAAEDMVEQSAAEILQMFLYRSSRYNIEGNTSEWTQEQAWSLIKALGSLAKHRFTRERQLALAKVGIAAGSDRGKSKVNPHSNISYEPLDTEPEISTSFFFLDPNFKSKDQQKALSALQQAEMINLVHDGGRNVAIKAGKPLYQAAFKAIIEDKVLHAIQESNLLETLMAGETKKIEKLEDEMRTLAKLTHRREVSERISYLTGKLRLSQDKIAAYEVEYLKQRAIMNGK